MYQPTPTDTTEYRHDKQKLTNKHNSEPGKNNPHKKGKRRTGDTWYSFIGNYSGIRKFSFGILIIMIHRLITIHARNIGK